MSNDKQNFNPRKRMRGGRFDYIKYDSKATHVQAQVKELVESLEAMVEHNVTLGRAKNKALEKLEEFYMWVGKGIRDDQIQRDTLHGRPATIQESLQEERGNS